MGQVEHIALSLRVKRLANTFEVSHTSKWTVSDMRNVGDLQTATMVSSAKSSSVVEPSREFPTNRFAFHSNCQVGVTHPTNTCTSFSKLFLLLPEAVVNQGLIPRGH